MALTEVACFEKRVVVPWGASCFKNGREFAPQSAVRTNFAGALFQEDRRSFVHSYSLRCRAKRIVTIAAIDRGPETHESITDVSDWLVQNDLGLLQMTLLPVFRTHQGQKILFVLSWFQQHCSPLVPSNFMNTKGSDENLHTFF